MVVTCGEWSGCEILLELYKWNMSVCAYIELSRQKQALISVCQLNLCLGRTFVSFWLLRRVFSRSCDFCCGVQLVLLDYESGDITS